MREAVYLVRAGIAPSIEAALQMDQVMRSAAILINRELDEVQAMLLARALAGGFGAAP